MFRKFGILFLIISITSVSIFAQSNRIGQTNNTITTAVPFLLIAPDARSGAMGDAGVATSPDGNSLHWNPAKYAFIKENAGVSISYIPWLRNLVGDIDFINLSGFKRIDKNQAFALSLMYFSLGNIEFTDNGGTFIKDYTPYEMSIDAAYALKLSDNFSGGTALRYIHSNLTGGYATDNQATKPGNAVAGDISMFYTKPITVDGKKSNLRIGVNISNLGMKMSYGDAAYQEFLPANLRVGTSYTIEIDDYNSFMATVDFNKLLVPTPPIFETDPTTGDTIMFGKNANVSVPTGVFQSFNDAPGGTKEELHEIMYSGGLEYLYNKQFAVRGGYFNEHETKGNRKYFTFGIGVKLNVFSLDFAYLVPSAGRQNPLANTMRFTLAFNFKGLKDEQKDKK